MQEQIAEIQQRLDGMQGQIQALNLVISRLLGELEPIQAAKIAIDLKIEQETVYDTADYATPEINLQTQQQILGSYIDLLSAIGKAKSE